MTQSSEETLAEIEELTRALDGQSGTPTGLMREHLEAARFYLLGSMPSEYEFSLKPRKRYALGYSGFRTSGSFGRILTNSETVRIRRLR